MYFKEDPRIPVECFYELRDQTIAQGGAMRGNIFISRLYASCIRVEWNYETK